MTVLTLQLRFHSTALRETQAWFLPGDCAAEWLREICAWNVPQAGITLRVVPRSMAGRTPIGVLITVAGRQPSRVSPRLQPYGLIAGRLFLPVNGRLEPAADDAELQSLLDPQTEYVWHPVAGLVSFKPDERLSVADLIERPPIADADWTRAEPGVSFNTRLVSVTAVEPPSIETILESGRDDIGTESDSLDQLPKSPGEKSPGMIGTAAMLPLWAAAKTVQWLTNLAPGGADRETWVNRLQDWASQMLSPEWRNARKRELDRLMNLLQDDPDQGLKYALPMGGDAGRGVAPPSSRLAPRNVDFRLGSGGGPADYWDVPPEMMLQLTARYRELADREIRLGRHRRAAYIYAELLGDLTSAAAALKTGGYFREAAVLYEAKLKQPHEAAKCLEEGGLWNEAISLYEKLNEYESAARIYRRLEQHEAADASYRRAVEHHQEKGNLLHAAHLLETELRAPDDAIVVLRTGWPDHTESVACLQREFQLYGQMGRHADADRRIDDLREQRLISDHTLRLAQVLSGTAGDYPDENVRHNAADTTRIVVSRRLLESREVNASPDHRLLASLEKLAPEDRLLRRDCDRYQRSAVVAPKGRPRTYRTSEPELVMQTKLQFGVDWVAGAASTKYFFAAGYYRRQLIVTRREWSAIDHAGVTVQWGSPIMSDQPVLLAPSPTDSEDVWIHLVDGPALPPREFPSEWSPRAIRSPPWSNGAIALMQTTHGVSWMVGRDVGCFAKAFSSTNLPILSHQINALPTTIPVPFHARSEGAFIGFEKWLVAVDSRNEQTQTELPGEIIALSGSIPHSRVRVAASFAEGGAVVWKDSSSIRRFGDGLIRPQTTFTVSGHLVAVDADVMEIYRSDRHQLTLHGSGESPGEPLQVLPVRRNEFAVLDRFGGLTICRIPGP